MKIVPKKAKSFPAGEIRVITFGEEALVELLLENLVENKERYFSFEDHLDNICHMYWNRDKHIVTYAVQNRNECLKKGSPDLKKIQEQYGITTKSLFQPTDYISIFDAGQAGQKAGQG